METRMETLDEGNIQRSGLFDNNEAGTGAGATINELLVPRTRTVRDPRGKIWKILICKKAIQLNKELRLFFESEY